MYISSLYCIPVIDTASKSTTSIMARYPKRDPKASILPANRSKQWKLLRIRRLSLLAGVHTKYSYRNFTYTISIRYGPFPGKIVFILHFLDKRNGWYSSEAGSRIFPRWWIQSRRQHKLWTNFFHGQTHRPCHSKFSTRSIWYGIFMMSLIHCLSFHLILNFQLIFS